MKGRKKWIKWEWGERWKGTTIANREMKENILKRSYIWPHSISWFLFIFSSIFLTCLPLPVLHICTHWVLLSTFVISACSPLVFSRVRIGCNLQRGARVLHPCIKDGWMIWCVCGISAEGLWAYGRLFMHVCVSYDANRTNCLDALPCFWCSV